MFTTPYPGSCGFWLLSIAEEILAAGQHHVGADLPIIRHGVIEAGFEPMSRNCRNMIARMHENVASLASAKGLFGEGIVRLLRNVAST